MPSLPNGTVHRLPTDFRAALLAKAAMATFWISLTPLARNEWICWVTDTKKDETRAKRIVVGLDKMSKGMRRPCCWAGCLHRERNGK